MPAITDQDGQVAQVVTGSASPSDQGLVVHIGSGPASGGPATIADGADVAEGATTDAEATGNGSVIAILKRIRTLLSGTLSVSSASATATLTNLSNAVANATALTANTSRKQATFYNDDTAVTGASVYLKLGATASATSFTVKIAPGGYYELPAPVYTGRVDVVATAATGTLRITELT